jgi:hypothetical protein
MRDLIEKLLRSPEPSIRYKVRVGVLGEDQESRAMKRLRNEIRKSDRVQRLLSERRPDGTIPHGAYSKWRGAHWVLAALADIGYPSGDASLIPLREQVLGWLLSDKHIQSVPIIDGRARRCGSQEGNALYALVTLGLADERVAGLADNLIMWQWPDGGWNCDRKPEATNSSYHESWIPLRALSLYAKTTGSNDALAATERTAELLLKRRLFRRQSDGGVISPMWTRLRYPAYWHYGILSALKVMAEAGFIGDERCSDALDLLESRRLRDGGFPAEGKSYHTPREGTTPGKRATGLSLVKWGVVHIRRMNEFVTADALYVLSAASRLGAR